MMPVEILKEGADYAAWDEEILEIGYGASPAEARANLVLATRDTHRELSMLGPDRLGPDLRRVLEVLNGRTMMAETTKEALDRMARVLRSEAAEVAARQVEKHGSLKDPVVTDRDYQRGVHDTYRRAADLLDEGKGG